MEALRTEIRRLARAYGASRATDLARRVDLLVLGAAVLGALVHRLVVPVPALEALRARWPLVLAVVGGLLGLRLLLRRLLVPAAAPRPTALAAKLDDRFGWQDDVGTAVGVSSDLATRPLEAFLVAQAAGRLREVEPAGLWPARVGGRRLRVALVVLFLLLLLLPGVSGILGGRGAGRGTDAGIGQRPGEGTEEPLDADRWMREHGRLLLRRIGDVEHPLRFEAVFVTDLPLPAPWRGPFELLWDDGAPIPLATVDEPAGERSRREDRIDLDALEALRPRMTPGEHLMRVRRVPAEGPWREAVLSNVLRVEIPPEGGGGGGGGGGEQPQPTPPPPAPPPPSPPAPTPEGPKEEPPRPPPDSGREEVVTPLVDEGERVRKEDAIVAVRDPEAGTKPPEPVPLEQALRDFDRIVERAVPAERFRPSERDFLRRYFEALRRAAAAQGPPR